MANVSVSYTFSNSTTADATQVNQNFTDIINGTSDGTKDFSISALTCAGNVTFNGNTTIGNASSDDLTVTASLASSIPIKTTNTYDVGSSTIGLQSIYFGSSGGAFTTRLIGGAAGASWTLTLPTAVPSASNAVFTGTTAGVGSWTSKTLLSISTKTSAYTLTSGDEIILANSSGGAFTLTLPAAASNSGKVYTIKKISTGSNAVTIDGNGAETIGGSATQALYIADDAISIVSDGSNWQILNQVLGEIALLAYLNTTKSGIASGTVQLDAEAVDTAGAFNTSTYTFTTPAPGLYELSAQAFFGSLDGATDANIAIQVGGSTVVQAYSSRLASNPTGTAYANISTFLHRLSASDAVTLLANGDASFDLNADSKRTFLALRRVAP